MLENFIEANQRQMQFLVDEANRVGYIALNNNQYLRVLKHHSWKGLRNFYSIKGLRKEQFYKDYPHLSRRYSRDDRVGRPNPKPPPLHKLVDVLFVNEPEPIRPDTVSEADSVTSNPEDILDDSDIDLLAPTNAEDFVSSPSEEESPGDQSSSGESSPHGSARQSPQDGANA